MLPVVSLFFPYLLGLGLFLPLFCKGVAEEILRLDDASRLQLLASLLVFGMDCNYALVLSLTSLKTSLIAGGALSTAGFVSFARSRIKGLPPISTPGWFAIFLALCAAALFFVLVDPVDGWDARSIWFFHAKMVYYHGSVDAAGDWSLPTMGFSHPDYPELVPILAAQVSHVAGYWNEYLPKLSLAALLVPALLSLMSLLCGRWWQVPFIAVPLFFTFEWLQNGYMDGYLGLYAGLGTFFLGRWLDEGRDLDLTSGILFLGTVLGLKNEGRLLCLIVSCSILLFVAGRRREGSPLRVPFSELPVLLFISSAGFFLWERKKHILHLQNDLQLGMSSIDRIAARLSDGSLPLILRHLYLVDRISLSLGILLLTLVLTVRTGRRPRRGAYFCALVGGLYFCGIVTIYLATPFDLISFHLPTGNRTMLPVHIILLAATLSLYSGAARKAQARAVTPDTSSPIRGAAREIQ